MKVLFILALFIGCSFATFIHHPKYIGLGASVGVGGQYIAPTAGAYYASPYAYSSGGYYPYVYNSWGLRSGYRRPYSSFYRF